MNKFLKFIGRKRELPPALIVNVNVDIHESPVTIVVDSEKVNFKDVEDKEKDAPTV